MLGLRFFPFILFMCGLFTFNPVPNPNPASNPNSNPNPNPNPDPEPTQANPTLSDDSGNSPVQGAMRNVKETSRLRTVKYPSNKCQIAFNLAWNNRHTPVE